MEYEKDRKKTERHAIHEVIRYVPEGEWMKGCIFELKMVEGLGEDEAKSSAQQGWFSEIHSTRLMIIDPNSSLRTC